MEAATLQKKKNTISKGKLKKSIKNVLCRPDQVYWPEITDEEGTRLESVLKKYKVDIPEFKKPHWKDLKLIPKDQRPKPPTLKKLDGLLLGIRECSDAIQNGNCSAIIIEAKVNPRLIVQPIIEKCTNKDIPLVCLNDLRIATAKYFGIPTSCLGVKCKSLLDISKEVDELAKKYPKPKLDKGKINDCKIEKMDVNEIITPPKIEVPKFEFLYRTNKKSRVFVPVSQDTTIKSMKTNFSGQDFIELSDKPETNSKAYMKMILKRISNNPDRVKKK